MLVNGLVISKRNGVLVNGMGCSFRRWGGVCTRDGVLVNGMGC